MTVDLVDASGMTISMYIATFAWLCLVAGYRFRANRRQHVPFVLTGIFLDIGLVLYLQLSRGAVQTALEFELSVLEQLHVWSSAGAMILYLPVLWLGFRLLLGNPDASTRLRHRRCAVSALVLRTIGFVLMFSMWK